MFSCEESRHMLGNWRRQNTCWMGGVLSGSYTRIRWRTVARRDYSVFRLSVWCTRPDLIPPAMDLVIVEPPIMVEEEPPVKRDWCTLLLSRLGSRWSRRCCWLIRLPFLHRPHRRRRRMRMAGAAAIAGDRIPNL
jgi:hypothetical protein